jgi:hypothetical protein
MKLPKFVFIAPSKSEISMGSGFVLHTKEPYELGRIIKLTPGPYSIINYVNEFKPLIHSVVDNYSILISFAGNLSGYKVRVNSQYWEADLQKLYEQMAHWFLIEKVENNKNYYKRYLNI